MYNYKYVLVESNTSLICRGLLESNFFDFQLMY